MENQQATLDEVGYLAAMLEGEGTVALNVRRKMATKRNNCIGIDLVLVIANTDKAIIDKCSDIIHKYQIEPSVRCYKRKHGWKDCWQVRIGRLADVYKILPILIPHMAGSKKRKSELIVQFLERRLTRIGWRSRTQRKGSAWYDKADWNMVRKIYEHDGKDLSKRVLRDYTPPAKLVKIL